MSEVIGVEPKPETFTHKKIFLHFGHGHEIPPIIYNQDFNATTIYVGIDTQTSGTVHEFEPTDLEIEKALKRPNVGFIIGNKPWLLYDDETHKPIETKSEGRLVGNISDKLPLVNRLGHLEFKDETADKVLIVNVLTDPHFQNEQEPQIFWEDSLRPLKIGGSITIIEVLHPASLGWLKSVAESYGLEQIEFVKGTDPDWKEKSSPYYGSGLGDGSEKSYLITFKKTRPTEVNESQ